MPKCPRCGSKNVAEIMYGLPGPDFDYDKAEKDGIELGGCVVSDHFPRWSCRACSRQWGTASV